jgi:hypothetical protein
MRLVKYVYLFFFFLVCHFTNAQNLIFSTEPGQFVIDIEKQFEKNLGAGVKTSVAEFSNQYKTILNDEGKKEIIILFQNFTKRGLKPIESYKAVSLLNGLLKPENIKSTPTEKVLKYLNQTLADLPAKRINETLLTLDLFLNKKYLYEGTFNKLLTLNTEFEYGFFEKKQDFFNPSAVVAINNTKPEEAKEDIGWGEQTSTEEYDPWNDPNLDLSKKQSSFEPDQINIPAIQDLMFIFKKVDLVMMSQSDSIVIQQTSGAFDLANAVFVGNKGDVIWKIKNSEAKAKLDKYSFKVQSSKFVADQVELEYPAVLKKNIKGVLEIKIEKRAADIPTSYPRFKSYKNDADLILNMPNYIYKGGLTLVGARVSSASKNEPFARLTVNKGIKNTFEVLSTNFIFTDTLITSDRVSFVTKFGKDSISHPAIKMRYDLVNKFLNLNKLEKSGFKNSMYSDTFHQIDIKSDAMGWKVDNGGKMDFYIIAAKTEIPAVFESFDNFIPDRIRYLSTASGYNPLILAGNIVARKKTNVFTIDELVDATKKERFIIANGVALANQMGFFDHNQLNNTYALSRKGTHYFLSFLGKKDFDDLVITSLAAAGGKPGNASIDLESKSLDIKGAQDFKLSDSLGISFVPKDQSMQIIGNKVFTFNGEIVVKNFKFYGDFEVQYENFLVKLKRIDSISFIPLDQYKKGGRRFICGNFIYGKTGTLYLNSPDNKSGRKKLIEYPKLEIPDGALVYFNEPGRIQKFDQQVNFKINTIKIDSLNAVNPVYAGTLNTGGIFKPINENLFVTPDSTMGISHNALSPYKLYGQESQLKTSTNIVLNNRGLKSAGEITHLALKLKTNQITFFTDHLVAKGEGGVVTETSTAKGYYFPQVNIAEYKMDWLPKEDSMAINSEKGFDFYAGSTILKGSIVLKQNGLFGNGNLDRADSDAGSENFKFNKTGFLAENAKFNIKSTEKDGKPVFSGKHVGVEFNVQSSNVKISSQNSDFNTQTASSIEFPYSSYSTTIDNAAWSIKDKKITMSGALENSVFRSTSATQYGLKFNGTAALYDIASTNLNISGVENINSVDASIVPNKGLVSVKKEGKLEPFTNAKIITDTLNKYHVLTNATVTINSKLSFTGNADYQFVNVSSDTFNIKLGNFEFAEISPEGNILNSKSSNRLSTIARAKVTEKDSVYLSPKMLYRGEIVMLSPFKNLSLNGSVLPDLKKYPLLGGNWINYKGNKSEEISINVDNTLKDGGKPLFVGLHIKNGVLSDAIYPTFLSAKRTEEDLDVFIASGVFKRDEPNKKFVVSQPNVAFGSNKYEFYDDKGLIAMEGRFNLLGAPSKIFETVGIANLSLDSMKYQFSTLMKFDFPLAPTLTQKLGQNIVKANLDAGNSDPAIVADSPFLLSKLKQFLEPKETEQYQTKSLKEHVPLFKASPKFLSTLILSDLDLKWNRVANSFHSIGKIGVSNIGDVDINAMVDGYVEVIKSPLTGDELYVFLEVSPTVWYYFGYKGGELGMTSSDSELNTLLTTPPAGKEKKSEVTFVDTAEALKFKKKFLQIYKGTKELDLVKKPNAKADLPNAPKTKLPAKKVDEKDGF